MNYFELTYLTNPPTESNIKNYYDSKGNVITKEEFEKRQNKLKQNNRS